MLHSFTHMRTYNQGYSDKGRGQHPPAPTLALLHRFARRRILEEVRGVERLHSRPEADKAIAVPLYIIDEMGAFDNVCSQDNQGYLIIDEMGASIAKSFHF